MSDTSQGPGWWLASDGRWYPPESWTGPPAGPASQPTTTAGRTQTATYGVGSASGTYGYGPYAASGAAAVPSTNGLGIASLVCSCAGLFFLPAIAGIVLGFVAHAQIRRSNGTQRGDGLAIAGIVVGLGWLVLIALGLAINASKSNDSVVGPAALAVLTAVIGPIALIGPFK
jgi:hypothetical protein